MLDNELKNTLLWFTFSQNNSGGYFIQNDAVDQYVIVQAPSAAKAIEKADSIFAEYSEYCECCGERWCTYFVDYTDGKASPMIYDKPITYAEGGWFREFAILHFWDGRVARVRLAIGSDCNVAEWVSGGSYSLSVFNEIVTPTVGNWQ
jgi:hypothetical protein